MRAYILILLSCIVLLAQVNGQKKGWIKESTPKNCSNTEYYDSVTFACKPCPDGSFKDKVNGQTCICPPGFKAKNLTRDFECERCPSGANMMRTECVSCGAVQDGFCSCPTHQYAYQKGKSITCTDCPIGWTTSDSKIEKTGQFKCKPCNSISIIYATEADSPFTKGKCTCKDPLSQVSDSCLKPADVTALSVDGFKGPNYNEVRYYDVMDAQDPPVKSEQIVKSAVFGALYLQAAIGCKDTTGDKETNLRFCQILGNLCTLQLYNGKSKACELFKEIAESRKTNGSVASIPPLALKAEKPESIPWLFYKPADNQKILSTPLELTVSFYKRGQSDRTQQLTYFLLQYNMDGTLKGKKEVELKTQMNSCPMTYDAVVKSKRFGVVTYDKCEFELNDLIDPEKQMDQKNTFYELFIQDARKKLVDVPVLVTNYKNKEGKGVNEYLQRGGTDASLLTRRFFIFDTCSGIEGKFEGCDMDKKPKYVRYATEVLLTVELDPNKFESILRPYLKVTYEEKAESLINKETKVSMVYLMDYSAEQDGFWNVVIVLIIITLIATLVAIIFRSCSFCQSNPKDDLGPDFNKNCCMHTWWLIFDLSSTIGFSVMFFLTFYWFAAYKMSDSVSLLLPTEYGEVAEYQTFLVFFGIVLFSKVMAIVLRICKQTTADIYIMDWERGRLPEYNVLHAVGIKTYSKDKDQAPILWRSTFMVNELNERQTESRRIYPETTLIWFSFFWIGLGWRWIAQTNPDIEVLNNPLEPVNLYLSFFSCSFIFVCIALVQWLYYLAKANISENGNFCTEYSFLCSIANCSVLIMDEHFHGYYIHGKAPWTSGKSDIPLAWLYQNLAKETEGLGSYSRSFGSDAAAGQQMGIAAPEITTYELYMQPWFRKQLKDITPAQIRAAQARAHLDEDTQNLNNQAAAPAEGEAEPLSVTQAAQAAKIDDPQEEARKIAGRNDRKEVDEIEAQERTKLEVNNFLVSKFSEVNSKAPYNIRPRTWCEWLCKNKPNDFILTSTYRQNPNQGQEMQNMNNRQGGNQFQNQGMQQNQPPVYSGSDTPFMLVRDEREKFPEFQEMLYSAMDWDIVILEVMLFFSFERYLEHNLGSNQWSMASIFLTYLVERFFRMVRGSLGEANLSKKTITDDRFLI